MISLKANLKWKYLWKCIHRKTFGTTEQQLKLRQTKEQNWNVVEIWSSPTTLKLGETRRRNAKVLEWEWKRVNPNAKELKSTRVERVTCMGHVVHGIVGTMDPHVDGHVMAGYENFVTWVRFTSRPIRGMLEERGWRWEDGPLGWGQNMSWRVFCTWRVHFLWPV
jgi:hypothetical protein